MKKRNTVNFVPDYKDPVKRGNTVFILNHFLYIEIYIYNY